MVEMEASSENSIWQLFNTGWSLQTGGKEVTLQSLLWQLIMGLMEGFVGVGDAPGCR